MSIYAYRCPKCDHLSGSHALVEPDGDLRDGPYRCAECGCERPQDAGDIPMTRDEFEIWNARNQQSEGTR